MKFIAVVASGTLFAAQASLSSASDSSKFMSFLPKSTSPRASLNIPFAIQGSSCNVEAFTTCMAAAAAKYGVEPVDDNLNEDPEYCPKFQLWLDAEKDCAVVNKCTAEVFADCSLFAYDQGVQTNPFCPTIKLCSDYGECKVSNVVSCFETTTFEYEIGSSNCEVQKLETEKVLAKCMSSCLDAAEQICDLQSSALKCGLDCKGTLANGPSSSAPADVVSVALTTALAGVVLRQ